MSLQFPVHGKIINFESKEGLSKSVFFVYGVHRLLSSLATVLSDFNVLNFE